MKIFFTLSLFLLSLAKINAQFVSPGTGITYTLNDLVTAGALTNTGAFYSLDNNITISLTDKLEILTNETVKFAADRSITVLGSINIDPPGKVTFTAQDPAISYNGVRLDGCASAIIKKLTFEYAVSMRILSCNPVIDGCTFQYNNNNASTTFGNGAIALVSSNPIITNCNFINNKRAGVQSSASNICVPQISNCYFFANDVSNANVPQINLGPTGTDTSRIMNNQIIGQYTNSGGIGYLPTSDVRVIIKNNIIRNNRYGVTFNGGSVINAVVSYNIIENNNIDGAPLTGGSGVSLTGGSATSHQNTIITGNYFKGNLWGVTIQGRSMPNLGNLMNADTTDDGKNIFIDNVNASGTQTELYNNSADNISAQGNFWNTTDPALIEGKIFHNPDNPAFGIVNYSSFLLPLRLVSFNGKASGIDALLNWNSENEMNSSGFEIQKSTDRQHFIPVGNVAAGAPSGNYTFTDAGAGIKNDRVYYRLKIIDQDGQFTYSPVVDVNFGGKNNSVHIYPSPVQRNQPVFAELNAARPQKINIQLTDATGRQIAGITRNVIKGFNKINISTGNDLPKGLVFIRFSGEDFTETQFIIAP